MLVLINLDSNIVNKQYCLNKRQSYLLIVITRATTKLFKFFSNPKCINL